jgi:dihydroorotate dehydrogenase
MILNKEFVISPPFGNWVEHQDCVSIKGSYTLHPRPGLIRQIIKTVRPYKGGIVNNIGLRNPGIYSIGPTRNDVIYSIAAIKEADWDLFRLIVPKHLHLELNLGCPNILTAPISKDSLESFIRMYPSCIVKVGIENPEPEIELALSSGAKYIHIGNTLPIKGKGGYSGPGNKRLVANLLVRYAGIKSVTFIAGGNIRNIDDISMYKDWGASMFSLCTAWLSPISTLRLLKDWKEKANDKTI